MVFIPWLLYPDHTSQELEHRHAPYVFWTVFPVKLGSLLLTNTLAVCSHIHLGILKFLQGSKDPGHGTIFVTRPSHVHYSRLTPKLKFLYQERATEERTTNTPKQFGKLYWYSVTVSVQPQLSLNLCIECIL